MIDLEKALLNPGAIFERARDVVERDDLSRQQKVEILRRWEYDIRELQVADDESMTAKEAPRVTPVSLNEVLDALRSLGAPADVEHSAPTKQGGSR